MTGRPKPIPAVTRHEAVNGIQEKVLVWLWEAPIQALVWMVKNLFTFVGICLTIFFWPQVKTKKCWWHFPFTGDSSWAAWYVQAWACKKRHTYLCQFSPLWKNVMVEKRGNNQKVNVEINVANKKKNQRKVKNLKKKRAKIFLAHFKHP